METLTKVQDKKMLETSLELLHQESIVWLNSIAFWEEESKFYSDLIENKLFQNVSEKDRKNVNDLLDAIIGNRLELFKQNISDHEKALSLLLQKDTGTVDYRHKHKLLARSFTAFEGQMKEFKKGVFELTKLVKTNFFSGHETLQTIHERRSVRKYKEEAVDKNHIEQIIRAGRMAPSAKNIQPWKFYVLTNTKKIKSYSTEITKVAEDILHLSLKALHKEEDPIFHGAPVVILIAAEKDDEWAPYDIGMCSQNMMLAARSLGYDTCTIGLAKALEKTPVYKNLNIPDTEKIHLAIILGRGDEKPKVHERKTDNITYLV
jgi:nitroreductase